MEASNMPPDPDIIRDILKQTTRVIMKRRDRPDQYIFKMANVDFGWAVVGTNGKTQYITIDELISQILRDIGRGDIAYIINEFPIETHIDYWIKDHKKS